ncbi:triose-phosphate isomerase [Candidatus Saccharibacteria bacterium]|nr:triose-phosphate isomerase [Candidatus Saccharibacteria bacterium]
MKTYIIGNWKMNFTVGESSLFLHKLLQKVPSYRDIETVVIPSLIAIQSLSLQTDRRKIKLGCQNFYHQDFGAYTGEVSIAQVRSLVDYAIVGHSERRYIFNESDKDIRAKVAAALRGGLTPILCIGETEAERKDGETADVLRDQLLGGLGDVSAEDISKVIVAYEPVWAISGHGKATVASPLDVKDAFKLIRKILKETYGKETAEETALLFGGSVKSTNAESYLLLDDCSGLLIGGASLIASEFTDIIEIAKRVKDERP